MKISIQKFICWLDDRFTSEINLEPHMELLWGDRRSLKYSNPAIKPSPVAIPPITVKTTQVVGGPSKLSSFISIVNF